ncbi:MAG TPA: N-acetylglutaminylglutamine amidotransferase [Azospirillaceae bacterium]|nr:N-acetylglutaminylglutamine amidotransferase [Azospirillaceae bacterium]
MCGICGEIRLDSGFASPSAVAAMAGVLIRRGPDGGGVWSQGPLAFGHRRLSIIDLSKASQQPMIDPALGLGIVFNGCIYNYPELRAELEGLGYRFFSHGDTEVLLKAYHAWGRRFVNRLYGMFAFALWERDSGRVVLGRDRLGIKPLYLAEAAGRLRFASSLPALLAAGEVDTGIDPIALHHYMSFHAVVPAPRTILKGVRKLPPATLLTLEPDGRRNEEVYWHPHFLPEEGCPEQDWQDAVLTTLRKAVERRLVADVPVGVLLSGGLDSSMIVALLAEAGQAGLQTFSIGFETVGNERGDEFQYSDLIAQRFGTRHHKLFIDSRRVLPALTDCVRAMAEPMVSHDAIGFFLLSQEVAKHVRVVQSGQGADEIFAGYHWYPPMMDAADPIAVYANVFFDRDHTEMAEVLNPPYLADHDASRAFVADHFAQPGADRPMDKALRLDTTVMLVEDPVKRVDNMTMAWGLEGRVPFLDHDVVELAARIPAELKVRGGGKYILKKAARRVVPAAVIDRPKGYFPVPALKYLRGPYLELVRDVLNQPAAQRRNLFKRDYIYRLLAEPETHITPLRGSKLWQVALLEFWLQTHGI